MSSPAAAISGIGGLLLQGIGLGNQIHAQKQEQANRDRNYQMQQDHFAYQKQTQQTTWDREDNAVQRRARDMKLAGISPHAAAGGAAQSSGPIGTKAPQREPGVDTRGASLISGALNTMANIAQTTIQSAYIRAQTKNLEMKNKIQEGTASESILAARLRNQYTGLQMESLQSDIKVKSATEAARIYQAEIAVQQAEANFSLFQSTKGAKIRKLISDANISEEAFQTLINTQEARIAGTESKTRLSEQQEQLIEKTMASVVGQEEAKLLATELANTDASKLPPRKRYIIDKVFNLVKMVLGFAPTKAATPKINYPIFR